MGTVTESLPKSLRLRLDLSYDGTHFHGWATQPGLRTVQAEVEAALSTLCRTPVTVTVAGRTDAGVHARHQVIHVDVPAGVWEALARPSEPKCSEAARDEGGSPALVKRMNGLLARAYATWAQAHDLHPPRGTSDALISEAQRVSSDFDARFAAIGRRYAYRLADGPSKDPLRRCDVTWVDGHLDVAAMAEAATMLLGEHDFLSYCRPREGATTIRTLRQLDVSREAGGLIRVDVAADAFCHSMVRSLVGALCEVGRGRRAVSWPAQLLADCSRSSAAPIAPAHGLSLEEVTYPPPEAWAARIAQARRRRDEDLPAAARGPEVRTD